MALEFTDANFQETVLDSNKVALVDFWAEWCGPCRMIGPIVEELATEYEGRALVGKVNVDNNNAIAMKYGIRSIPTILFIKGGGSSGQASRCSFQRLPSNRNCRLIWHLLLSRVELERF